MAFSVDANPLRDRYSEVTKSRETGGGGGLRARGDTATSGRADRFSEGNFSRRRHCSREVSAPGVSLTLFILFLFLSISLSPSLSLPIAARSVFLPGSRSLFKRSRTLCPDPSSRNLPAIPRALSFPREKRAPSRNVAVPELIDGVSSLMKEQE